MQTNNSNAKFEDDKFVHLESDISKIRGRFRQYISYSNEKGAASVVTELLYNCIDECRNPKSPGNKIHVEFDERDGFIRVDDDGRGIPLGILEKVYTSLNMGSNIDTSDKASLKAETLGQNGTGTLAICGLAERVEITSYRGGTEDKYKTLVFEEGIKVDEKDGKCAPNKHGMSIRFKPSKIMGKNTRIVWDDVHTELVNFQFMNKQGIKVDSIYYDKDGNVTNEKYKALPFVEILNRNNKETFISQKYSFTIDADNVDEEIDGRIIKRFLSMDLVFVYTSSLTPYIDSYSNSNNTVDNGDHLDGAIEALCRFLQTSTKNSLGEKEKEKLDIKWEDVKNGLSIAVALRTNFERLYTGQTKHKVVSNDIRKIIVNLLSDYFNTYFTKNQSQLKELINIVKMNAKARREGDKIRTAVVKNTLTNWSSFKMKNFDACTNKGKEYKELFIIEGDSAKGLLKQARDPRFQALFAIRGVSLNVFKVDIDQIVGPKGNREFTDLITVMGCNVGSKFDLSKLNYDKIIIASDADVDGLFIRSLLMAFYFKIFPEIIEDGRLFIAEPPLYRINDKKDPFVINTTDYINRYVKLASNNYKLGYQLTKDELNIEWLNKDQWFKFLGDTSKYVDTMKSLVDRYKVNDRLLEIILEEFASFGNETPYNVINKLDIQHMMNRIGVEFPELYYDDKNNLVKGSIDAKWQMIEISESLVKKSKDIINIMIEWLPPENGSIVLRDAKTKMDSRLSLLETLKILKKYQPDILHRFKGLGENDPDDLKATIMNPNSRTLIRVNIGDVENDMKIFQVLRGGSPIDALNRKSMMQQFKINREDIDT